MTMSLGAGRLDDMRRRSSVTKLETSEANNNITSFDGTDVHPGRYVARTALNCYHVTTASLGYLLVLFGLVMLEL
jgi:hypothetical protein